MYKDGYQCSQARFDDVTTGTWEDGMITATTLTCSQQTSVFQVIGTT